MSDMSLLFAYFVLVATRVDIGPADAGTQPSESWRQLTEAVHHDVTISERSKLRTALKLRTAAIEAYAYNTEMPVWKNEGNKPTAVFPCETVKGTMDAAIDDWCPTKSGPYKLTASETNSAWKAILDVWDADPTDEAATNAGGCCWYPRHALVLRDNAGAILDIIDVCFFCGTALNRADALAGRFLTQAAERRLAIIFRAAHFSGEPNGSIPEVPRGNPAARRGCWAVNRGEEGSTSMCRAPK